MLSLALALVACSEEPAPNVTPLPPVENARPAPIAAEPSPAIVSPHLRRAPSSTASTGSDLSRPPARGGGGGGEWWKPRPAPEPSAREVAAFSERLQREIASNVDPDDAPCEQVFDLMRAGATASQEPGQRELPSRAELRRRCGELPEEMEKCMSPDYFRANATECNRAITRLAERGERLMADAQEREEPGRKGNARR